MGRVRCPTPIVILVLACIATAAPAYSQDWRDFRTARQAGGLGSVEVELLYLGGSLYVYPFANQLLYDARLRYDAERWAPLRNWRREGDVGHLQLGVSPLGDDSEAGDRGEAGSSLRFDGEFGFDLDDLRIGGSGNSGESSELSLALHPRVPARLRVRVGAGRTRLDLGGMTLASFDFATGAGNVRIGFGRENGVPMELLSMKSGATALVAEGLGNARFERMEFYSLVGDVVLDFSGAWTSSAEADIKMAVGQLTIRVPSEVGLRLRRTGFASVSAEGMVKEDDVYLSPNWAVARVRLDLAVTAVAGSVEVERG